MTIIQDNGQTWIEFHTIAATTSPFVPGTFDEVDFDLDRAGIFLGMAINATYRNGTSRDYLGFVRLQTDVEAVTGDDITGLRAVFNNEDAANITAPIIGIMIWLKSKGRP